MTGSSRARASRPETPEPLATPPGTVPARAKLNLYLHLLGRRGDGYHLLDSLIVFAELGDAIAVAPAERLRLTVTGPFGASLAAGLDSWESNIVTRAARALAAEAGIGAGAAIELEKNLPHAAGLGGGSSDAAATLRALARLWQLDLESETLEALALGLGADVPACLRQPEAVFVGGIGAEVRAAPRLPPVAALLVNPGTELSTAAVFRAFEGAWSGPGRFGDAPASAADLAALLGERQNDLEIPARSLAPEIGAVLAALAALPGALLARMSGSGATCFALFESSEEAEAGARILARAQPGWWIHATRLAGS